MDVIDINARERRDNEGFSHAEPYRRRAKPGTANGAPFAARSPPPGGRLSCSNYKIIACAGTTPIIVQRSIAAPLAPL